MFPLRSEPMPDRKWEQARDGDYSCRLSPLREPMPSDPSCTDGMDKDGLGGAVSATAGAAGDSAAAVVVAGRPATEQVLEQLLDGGGRRGLADKVSAKFAMARPAERHVVTQDLDL